MQSLGSPLEGSDKPVEAGDELVAMGDIVNARAVEKKPETMAHIASRSAEAAFIASKLCLTMASGAAPK